MSLKFTCITIVFSSFLVSTSAKEQAASVSGDTLTGMTITDLAKFDGKDGHKAYVAVDSIIYDVTNVKPWKGGQHNGNKAGTDISDKILKAPHAKKPIKKLNKVGKLIPTPVAADTTQD
jgi:predicted heme/steroid binding protein